MICATIDGERRDFPDGISILEALERSGIEIGALCADPRLRPAGTCRLCSVERAGEARPVVACTTPLLDGDRISTESEALREFRHGMLALLAEHVQERSVEALPEKPLHRALRQQGLAGSGAASASVDESHPCIRFDPAQCILCLRCVRICDELQGESVWHVVERGGRSHLAFDRGTTLAGSSCVGCGACVDTCPSAALADRSRLERGAPQSWVRTTCAYCGVGCELELGCRDGGVVQARPVPQSPVSRGHLCIKGRYAFDYLSAPDRITTPLIRRGRHWVAVGWDEALAHCAAGLGRIVRDRGADAVGVLGSARASNEDNYLAQKFARTVLGTHNVDCCARVCHTPTAIAMKAMLGTGAATNSFDDVEHAAAFLLVGCNPLGSHPVVGARIRQQVRRGARLVVIDPRRTELARIADVHLALRPGTDIPLLHAIARIVIEEGLVDTAFLRERVDGFEAFRAFVAGWTPERAAEVCGLQPQQILAAARLYGQQRPAMCFHGLGVTEHVQGTDGVKALINLALLTGNLGRRGSGINPLRGQNNVQGAALMGCDPALLTGGAPVEAARERFESAWQARLPRVPGLDVLQMVDAAGEGRLAALWAIGYDVAMTLADADRVAAALERLDLVIVQDFVLNETASRVGHVFLPVATAYEKDGTVMNAERRVSRLRRAVAPPAGALPDWRIICDLAHRMGHAAGFAFDSPAAVWDEVRRVWPAVAGITYGRLEHGGLQWPCPDERHPGTTVLHQAGFVHGPRAALQPIEYRPTPERIDDQFPWLLVTGRHLYQFNAGTMTHRSRSESLRPEDRLEVSVADARRLGLADGTPLQVTSRYGAMVLRASIGDAVRDGVVFATFHDPARRVNRVTGPHRDAQAHTPEYKVTAVRLEAAPGVAC